MRKLFQLALIVVLFVSCNKDKDTDLPLDPSSITKEYFPLEIGNYWVYQTFIIDTLGNETETATTDSIVITKLEIINGNSYYVFKGTNSPVIKVHDVIDFMRDSSGYIVDHNGLIRFTAINFTDTLISNPYIVNDELFYTQTYKMEEVNQLVSVPAGKFNVLNFRGTLTVPFQYPGLRNPRFTNAFYAKGVGKILDSYYYLHSSTRYEKRLIRYHIEKNK